MRLAQVGVWTKDAMFQELWHVTDVKDDDRYSEKEAQARFEAALKGALKTSPKPLKDKPKVKKKKAKKARSKEARRK